MTKLRVATRGSDLALWQANFVAGLLSATWPAVDIELLLVETEPERRLDLQIWELGGKGAFAKPVQQAVIDGRADIAVHSAKDLPAITPKELVLAAVPERGDPRDALIGCTLAELPEGAVVATGALRRQAQLAHARPDLRFEGLRGNVPTRLEKASQFAAIVLAAAGLDRLGLADRIAERLPIDVMLPQVGQGALAVECRRDDHDVRPLLERIEHSPTGACIDAERGFLAELGGNCSLPAAAHARLAGDGLSVEGVIASPDGTTLLRETVKGPASANAALGRRLAHYLLHERGGEALLQREP